ncbi:MAG: alcohol dehydrogenase catalytic domain-containing protein [Chloroflexia bacterium]
MLPETMTAVLKSAPGPGAEIATAPLPLIGPTDVLLKVLATSICGTDLHIYKWNAWAAGRMTTPRIPGHEFCGEVVQVGEHVESLRLGDYVSGESHVPCGWCYPCRTACVTSAPTSRSSVWTSTGRSRSTFACRK